ncbi:MAG: hypothetical protein ACRDAG_01260 [Cetobacterium somerae]|uniref:hypothetical protein n=1 Tax=Cetobacterium somerae TaxID=188913 RepID=UPI003F3DC223
MDKLDKMIIKVRISRNKALRELKRNLKKHYVNVLYREFYEEICSKYDVLLEELLSSREVRKFQEVLK